MIALAYLIFLCLISTHSFYYIVSELPLGIAFIFIWWAAFERYNQSLKKKIGHIVIGLLCLLTALYAHPLLLIPFFFLTIFLLADKNNSRAILLMTTVLIVFITILKNTVFTSTYDSTTMEKLINFQYLFPNYLTTQANKNFARYLISDYYFLPILYFINAFFYLKKRRWFKLLLMTTFLAGFTLLVNVTYHGGGHQFYYENQYLILVVFVVVPFIADTLPSLNKKSYALATAIPILIIGCYSLRIIKTKTFYTNMLNQKRIILNNMSPLASNLVLITPAQISNASYLDTWSHPYEYWLLSTLEKGYSQATVIETKPGEYNWAISSPENFISVFESTPYNKLNILYFKYSDSTPIKRYKSTE